jgi:hypothetical protein
MHQFIFGRTVSHLPNAWEPWGTQPIDRLAAQSDVDLQSEPPP